MGGYRGGPGENAARFPAKPGSVAADSMVVLGSASDCKLSQVRTGWALAATASNSAIVTGRMDLFTSDSSLFAPYRSRNLHNAAQLRPLLLFRESVALLGAGEAALRTEAKLAQINEARGLGNASLQVGPPVPAHLLWKLPDQEPPSYSRARTAMARSRRRVPYRTP